MFFTIIIKNCLVSAGWAPSPHIPLAAESLLTPRYTSRPPAPGVAGRCLRTARGRACARCSSGAGRRWWSAGSGWALSRRGHRPLPPPFDLPERVGSRSARNSWKPVSCVGKGDRIPLFLNRTRAPARFPLFLRLTVRPGPWISRSCKSTGEARKLGHKSDGVESLMLRISSLVKNYPWHRHSNTITKMEKT